MSVSAVTKNGRPCWQVQVIRGSKRIRRYLDRKRFLRQDALGLERHLADLDADHPGEPDPSSAATITAPDAAPPAIAEPPAPEPLTFAAFAERYLALQDKARSDYKNKVRNLRMHLLPILGDLPLAAITRMRIDELRVALRTPGDEPASSRRSLTRPEAPLTRRRKGGPRSPKTINNVLATLRAVLRLAGDYDLIDKVPRIPFEADARKDPAFLDFDEAEAFLAAAPGAWRLLLRTAIRTGLRRGELLELRWRDLHLDAATPFVRVSRAIRQERGGEWTVKEPKGRRARSVPLTGSLAAELRARRTEIQADPDGLVFPAEGGEVELASGGQHWRFDQLYAAVRQTARDAGLRKHVHPHLLRHTFASHCYMQRVPPQVVQKWLGHASVTTTERYAHLRPDTDDALIDVLESIPETSGGVPLAPRRAQDPQRTQPTSRCAAARFTVPLLDEDPLSPPHECPMRTVLRRPASDRGQQRTNLDLASGSRSCTTTYHPNLR